LQLGVAILDRNNRVVEYLGDDAASDWRKTRTLAQDQFGPGKLIASHGACFDHVGNMFVVGRVEIGRVTKLAQGLRLVFGSPLLLGNKPRHVE
jgi:hypothetical protein